MREREKIKTRYFAPQYHLKKTRISNVKNVITKSQLLTWRPYVFTVFPNTLSVLNANLILKLRKKLWSIWYHFTSSIFNNVSFAPTFVLIQRGLTIICQRNIHKLEGAHLNSKKKSLCQGLNLPCSINWINHEKEMFKPFSQFVLDNKPMKTILRKILQLQ